MEFAVVLSSKQERLSLKFKCNPISAEISSILQLIFLFFYLEFQVRIPSYQSKSKNS